MVRALPGQPYEIKDKAAGEVLDVVQDDDPDLPPEDVRCGARASLVSGGFE